MLETRPMAGRSQPSSHPMLGLWVTGSQVPVGGRWLQPTALCPPHPPSSPSALVRVGIFSSAPDPGDFPWDATGAYTHRTRLYEVYRWRG